MNINKALFKSWFLIGSGTTRAMKTGLLNETKVLNNLFKWLEDNKHHRTYSDINGLSVSIELENFGLRSCGIVASNKHQFMASSPDGLSVISIKKNDVCINNVFLPIEIKTRSADDKIRFANSKMNFEYLHVRYSNMEDFENCIPDRQNRVQVIRFFIHRINRY